MYKGNFEDVKDVCEQFQIDVKEIKDCKILLAWYGYGDYDGSAFVLFDRDGQLYEVNGGHCSCYGLEGQWDPEKVSAKELKHRIESGSLGKESYYDEGVFDVALKKILTRWEKSHQ